MQDLKISLITVSFNAEKTIGRCIQSVIAQKYNNVEYIIIDGASTDNTLQIINQYRNKISLVLSELDSGIYDAMNKGIKIATGNIIGMLNADDYFTDNDVLSDVALKFINNKEKILYADLDYVNNEGNTIRKWRSGKYNHGMFSSGWMPPHPTFYCKKELFEQFGYYNLNYGTAGDYELMLRFMHLNKLEAIYLKKVIIKMIIGGKSNKSISSRVKGLFFDFKAMQNNGILLPFITLIFKPLRKIIQYF